MSEVPCRLIGDPHERFNKPHTVLNYYSAKLKWLWRCGLLTAGQKDPVELYYNLALTVNIGLF